MRPLAGPWLSVSISPALRSGHKGHALGPFTATAQMLGSICYGWGQRSPVNFWFHSIHQLYGHGASYTCRGSRGDTAHLTGPIYSPADRGSEDPSASTSLKNELSRGQRCGERWGKSDWMNEWWDEHRNMDYWWFRDWREDGNRNVVSGKVNKHTVCVCWKLQSPNVHQVII